MSDKVTEAAPGKPVRWRLDLALGIIVAIGFQVVLLGMRWWGYFAGRANEAPFRLEFYAAFFPVVFCILIFVVQTLRKWCRIGWISRSLRLLAVGWLLTGVLGFTLTSEQLFQVWVMPIRPFVPRQNVFLHGLKQWVEEHADIEAIREWAKTRSKEPKEGSPFITDTAQWPPCVQALRPSAVAVQDDAEVTIGWGGGFFHWWMVIYPEHAGASEMEDNEFHAVLRIAPGVVLCNDR